MTTHMLMRSMAVAAALAVPGALSAQDPNVEGYDPEPVSSRAQTFDIDARAGVAVPVDRLMDYTQPGLAAGLGAAWWMSDRVALRADGDFSALNGEEAGPAGAATPNTQLYHYGLGLEFDMSPNLRENPWDIALNVGAGGTTLDTETFDGIDGGETELTTTRPNVNAGLEVGRRVGENVMVSVSGKAFYTFLDEDELSPIAELRDADALTRGIEVPLTLSVRWDLPRTTGLGN